MVFDTHRDFKRDNVLRGECLFFASIFVQSDDIVLGSDPAGIERFDGAGELLSGTRRPS